MSNVVSVKEAKERLSRIGKSAPDLAKELGVSLTVVQSVLNGRLKGERGDAHIVAVTLGLKDGLIVPDDMPIAEAMKAAAR